MLRMHWKPSQDQIHVLGSLSMLNVVSRCLDASHCLRQCWYWYMVTFMTFSFNSWGLRQEARSADMEVPVLTLLSKQLQGELQFARYRKAHFTKGWRGKVTKLANVPYMYDICTYIFIYIYIYSRMKKIVFRAFWNWWRRNQFEISSWICASNIPKFFFSEPHDNVRHPNSLFFPFGSFLSLLLLEPQALCQLPVVDNLLQMPDLQVLQAGCPVVRLPWAWVVSHWRWNMETNMGSTD